MHRWNQDLTSTRCDSRKDNMMTEAEEVTVLVAVDGSELAYKAVECEYIGHSGDTLVDCMNHVSSLSFAFDVKVCISLSQGTWRICTPPITFWSSSMSQNHSYQFLQVSQLNFLTGVWRSMYLWSQPQVKQADISFSLSHFNCSGFGFNIYWSYVEGVCLQSARSTSWNWKAREQARREKRGKIRSVWRELNNDQWTCRLVLRVSSLRQNSKSNKQFCVNHLVSLPSVQFQNPKTRVLVIYSCGSSGITNWGRSRCPIGWIRRPWGSPLNQECFMWGNVSGQSCNFVRPWVKRLISGCGSLIKSLESVTDSSHSSQFSLVFCFIKRKWVTLRCLWEQFCATSLQAKFEFVSREGDAGQEICHLAKERQARLVIVGARGLGKLRRTILGSVSSYILHHAHCAVNIFRSKATSELKWIRQLFCGRIFLDRGVNFPQNARNSGVK